MALVKNKGIDPTYYSKIAQAESENNPNARNPIKGQTASGLYQFTESTWKNMVDELGLNYSLEDRFDPNKSKVVVEAFTKQNASILQKSLGREPNDTDLYMAHFLGAGGASWWLKRLANDPNGSTGLSDKIINANKNVFYKKNGQLRTNQEVYDEMNRRLNKKQNSSTSNNHTHFEKEVIIPNIYTDLTNFVTPPQTNTFVTPTEENQTEQKMTEEEKVVEQKTNELNLLKDLYSGKIQTQPQQEEEQPQAEIPQIDVMQQYAEISNLIDQGREGGFFEGWAFNTMQQGGTWDKQQKLVKAEKDIKLKKLLSDKNLIEKLKEQSKNKNIVLKETNLIEPDATKTVVKNRPELFSKVARNKTNKEIAEEREYKIQQSVKAQDEDIIGNVDWRNTLAKQTQSTGDKFRVNLEPNFFDDYLNPVAMIGGMASNLGQAPLRAQQTDSYIPYVTAVGTPLTVGALAGIGTQNTGQFVNNLANPLAGTGSILKTGLKQLKNQGDLIKDLIFDKNTTLNKNFIFDSKNKIYSQIEEGFNTLDRALEQKIADLQTTEGKKRLINQEKEYLQQTFGDIPYYDEEFIDKLAKSNANVRIEELENIKAFGNKNKEFVYNIDRNKVGKLGIIKPSIETAQYSFGIPKNNAHYSFEDISEKILWDLKAEEMLPGKLTLGTGFTNSTPTAFHEINHALQRNRILKIDNELKNIIPDYKKNLSYDDIDAYTYFLSGSGGQESSSFLAELREQMKQDGFIQNTYDEITPELIEKVKDYYSKNKTKKVFIDGSWLTGVTNTRILDFARPIPENYKIISDAMNKLPAIVPIAGVAYLSTQNNKQETPQYQQGGKIKTTPLGQYEFPGEITRVPSNQITMKNVPQALLGVSNTGEKRIMLPEEEHTFQNATEVTEIPLSFKELYKLKTGKELK